MSSSSLSKNLKIKIYKTIILPVVLYGCETWSLTLREERKLRVSENRVKGKAIPLQAWTGPEGSRRLRLPDFKTVGT